MRYLANISVVIKARDEEYAKKEVEKFVEHLSLPIENPDVPESITSPRFHGQIMMYYK